MDQKQRSTPRIVMPLLIAGAICCSYGVAQAQRPANGYPVDPDSPPPPGTPAEIIYPADPCVPLPPGVSPEIAYFIEPCITVEPEIPVIEPKPIEPCPGPNAMLTPEYPIEPCIPVFPGVPPEIFDVSSGNAADRFEDTAVYVETSESSAEPTGGGLLRD